MRKWRALAGGLAGFALVVQLAALCPCASAAETDAHACCAPSAGISAPEQGCCETHASLSPRLAPEAPVPAVNLPLARTAPALVTPLAGVVGAVHTVPHATPPLVLRI